MKKIASPQDLTQELRQIIGYCDNTPKPSRLAIAKQLRSLATRVAADAYKTLEDAGATIDTRYGRPGANIWYYKDSPEERDLIMGSKWMEKQGVPLPTRSTIKNTHVLIGQIRAHDLGEIFEMMQGEQWSPNGEARELIQKSGAHHTSMSIGDVIETAGDFYLVDRHGFTKCPRG